MKRNLLLLFSGLMLFGFTNSKVQAQITASGAGVSVINGVYANTFPYEGKNAWTDSPNYYDILWRSDVTEWRFTDASGNGRYYYNTAQTPNPPDQGWQVGPDGVAPAPALSGDVTVQAVTVTGNQLGATLVPGDTVAVTRLSFSSISGDPSISTIKFDRTGTADNTDIPTAELWVDDGGDGVFHDSDTKLEGPTSFTGSSVTFTALVYNPTVSLLIVFDVASGANTSHTAGVSMGTDYITSFNAAISFAGFSTTDVSLSVQAADFAAKSDIGSVTLSWTTHSEVNNAGFNVLRQQSGMSNWELVGGYKTDQTLQGLGTSNMGRVYQFTDNKVKSGSTYNYEIESVSTSGTVSELKTISVTVDMPTAYSLYQNYPNPFNPSTTIRFDLKQQSTVTLEVYNVLGQKVMEQQYGQMDAGRYNEVVSMDRFASGVYYYRIVARGNDGQKFVSVKKLVLMK